MLTSLIPSFFLGTYSLCHLSDVRHYASSLVFLSSGQFSVFFPRPFQEWHQISYKRDDTGVYLFGETPAAVLAFEMFSHLLAIVFLIVFFHFHLFDCVRFQYSQELVGFFFSRRSDFFLGGGCQFYSFCHLSFPRFHYKPDIYFNVKFDSNIWTLYPYRLY